MPKLTKETLINGVLRCGRRWSLRNPGTGRPTFKPLGEVTLASRAFHWTTRFNSWSELRHWPGFLGDVAAFGVWLKTDIFATHEAETAAGFVKGMLQSYGFTYRGLDKHEFWNQLVTLIGSRRIGGIKKLLESNYSPPKRSTTT